MLVEPLFPEMAVACSPNVFVSGMIFMYELKFVVLSRANETRPLIVLVNETLKIFNFPTSAGLGYDTVTGLRLQVNKFWFAKAHVLIHAINREFGSRIPICGLQTAGSCRLASKFYIITSKKQSPTHSSVLSNRNMLSETCFGVNSHTCSE